MGEPSDRSRIFLFHHAGGTGRTFSGWGALWPDYDVVSVEYPGRGESIRQPLASSIAALVDHLEARHAPQFESGRPFAFFGHSLGALVAHALALRLRAKGGPLPNWLGVSSIPWPGSPAFAAARFGRHEAPDAELIAELEATGTPSALLAHAGFRDVLLRTLRADLRVAESCAPPSSERLAIPMSAFGGARDPHVPPRALEEWGVATTGRFTTRTFSCGGDAASPIGASVADVSRAEAGHFYLFESPSARSAVADAIRTEVEKALGRRET